MISKLIQLLMYNWSETSATVTRENEEAYNMMGTEEAEYYDPMDVSNVPEAVEWDAINSLPVEIIAAIFSNLSLRDLGVVPLVCKRWRDASLRENLWRRFCERHLPTICFQRYLREKEEDHLTWREFFRERVLRKKLPYLIIGAEGDTKRLEEVQQFLNEQGLKHVEIFNAKDSSPTFKHLQQYSSVLCFSYFGFGNPTTLGNVLAKYVEHGGGVIIMCYANCGPGNMLKGDWEKKGYDPIIPKDTSRTSEANGLGEIRILDHPIMEGVKTFNGGLQNSHSRGDLNASSRVIASWSSGSPLVVELVGKTKGKLVCLNFYPPTSRVAPYERLPNTDGDKMIANALCYCTPSAKPYRFS